MAIGESLTVRCGCYEKYDEASEHLKELKNESKLAVIATTYKYRFEDNVVEKEVLSKQRKNSISTEDIQQDEEEMRLLLQVFLYKGDLEDAYDVAKLGVKKYPHSSYWNQKMAEITQWTHRPKESLKYRLALYKIKKDPKIEEELIKYGLDTFSYEQITPLVLEKLRKDPNEENIDLMALIFAKTGEPEKILSILDSEYKQDPKNVLLLQKALQYSLQMGDMDSAKKYVDIFEARGTYSIPSAVLMSRYYYIKYDIEKSYQSLMNASEEHAQDSEQYDEYNRIKSDLGW
jgi:predicted Zn-dependent protease